MVEGLEGTVAWNSHRKGLRFGCLGRESVARGRDLIPLAETGLRRL
jgi:hypothetical protein